MTLSELIDILPDKIVLPTENPIDEYDNDDWYAFNLSKDKNIYILSYHCWLKDKELISFEGRLDDVARKMHEWCNKCGYLEKQ